MGHEQGGWGHINNACLILDQPSLVWDDSSSGNKKVCFPYGRIKWSGFEGEKVLSEEFLAIYFELEWLIVLLILPCKAVCGTLPIFVGFNLPFRVIRCLVVIILGRTYLVGLASVTFLYSN